MKSLLLLVTCIVLILLVQVSFVQAEVIEKFDAAYFVADSGVVTVEETITYNFEDVERHGIFRTIENNHPQKASAWYKKRFIDLEVESVTRKGVKEPFSISQTSNVTEIKIGSEALTLTGLQTYVIQYVLNGAVSHGENGAELYYNVTGNQWEVPIKLAVVTVSTNHFGSKYQCYQGVMGATTACTNSFKNNTVITFTANSIQPGEGLTIATELNAAIIQEIKKEAVTWILFGSGMAGVWVIGLIYLVYRFRRSASRPSPVIAQYEPYKDFLPMHTGYLADNQLNPQDITAGIIYLAQQGFLKLTRTTNAVLYIFKNTDYEVTLLRPLSEIQTKFLSTVTELFFASSANVGTTVLLSSLKREAAKNAEKILYLHRDIEADLIKHGFYSKSVPNARQLFYKTCILIVVFLVDCCWSQMEYLF